LIASRIQEVPLKIVGSNVFGRYPKISVEQTINMIMSDDFLVDFAGYQNVRTLVNGQDGRGLYSSARGNLMIAVVGASVVKITSSSTGLVSIIVGTLLTSEGDIFIAENNNAEILISDNHQLYVYNWSTGAFKQSPGDFTIPFTPGFVSFQNGRFIAAGLGTSSWYLSGFNNGTSWSNAANFVGSLQTKPDTVQACVPFPGRGNLLFVFGSTVTEAWTDVGAALFPYQKSSTFNIDYGCLNPQTIAWNESIIVWLAANEKSGPAIMYSTGGELTKISNDGIDFKFAELTAPQDSYGFLFRQDGHLIYMITFPTDNLSYIYDFQTKAFFTVTDEDLNHHIARRIVFFNNDYYFVSFNDGNLYQISTDFTNFQYSATDISQIPRIRFCPPLRLPNQKNFIGNSLGFVIENGQINTINNSIPNVPISDMCVDLAVSRDGGETFGNFWRQNLNPTGIRKSRFIYQRLGIVNDATFQLRFVGSNRFVVGNGLVEIRQ
jgi:hypothetical protein